MLVTKEQLIDLGACTDGLDRFIKQTGNTNEAVVVSSLVGGENTTGDVLWLAGKTLPKEKIVKFACDCALLNINRIKPYTDKFELILEFLKAPTQGENADAAADAAYAARAARAAYAAASGAGATAYAAADAARAAYAAARSAGAAAGAGAGAYAAADAADAAYAARAAYAEINRLLIELFA